MINYEFLKVAIYNRHRLTGNALRLTTGTGQLFKFLLSSCKRTSGLTACLNNLGVTSLEILHNIMFLGLYQIIVLNRISSSYKKKLFSTDLDTVFHK